MKPAHFSAFVLFLVWFLSGGITWADNGQTVPPRSGSVTRMEATCIVKIRVVNGQIVDLWAVQAHRSLPPLQ
jgi:hypothetical protein